MSLNKETINAAMVYAELYKKKNEALKPPPENEEQPQVTSQMETKVNQIHAFLFGGSPELRENFALKSSEAPNAPVRGSPETGGAPGRKELERGTSGAPKNEGGAVKARPHSEERQESEFLDFESNNRLFKLITHSISFTPGDIEIVNRRLKKLLKSENGLRGGVGKKGGQAKGVTAENLYLTLVNDRISEKVHDTFAPEEQKNSIMNKIFFGTICHDIVKFLIEMMYDKLQVVSAFATNRYPQGKTRSARETRGNSRHHAATRGG